MRKENVLNTRLNLYSFQPKNKSPACWWESPLEISAQSLWPFLRFQQSKKQTYKQTDRHTCAFFQKKR